MARQLVDELKERLGSIEEVFSRRPANHGNKACAHFCKSVFPPGRERGKCVSDAAKGVPGNLCAACDADITRVCSAPNGSKTCCPSDEPVTPKQEHVRGPVNAPTSSASRSWMIPTGLAAGRNAG